MASFTKMSEAHIASAVQVKKKPKATSIIKKLDVINRLEKHEQIVNISHNIRFVHISISTICDDNTDRNTESATLGTTTVLLE